MSVILWVGRKQKNKKEERVTGFELNCCNKMKWTDDRL